MPDAFRTAKLARKQRVKWWRNHIALAYITLICFFVVTYVVVALLDRHLPLWLATLGVSPSGVNLLLGTVWCGLGIWGLRTGTRYGAGWIVLYTLCLLGGVLTLGKAFGFI
jgi:hypothetical protein